MQKNKNKLQILLTVELLIAKAATGALCFFNCLTKAFVHKSHTIAVQSLLPETTILYVSLAAKQVTASVCPYRLSIIFKDLLFKSNSHTVRTYNKL